MGFGHTWGHQKVNYRKPEQKRTYSMSASWTDLEPVNPYVALSSGRSFRRPEDLLAMARLVRQLCHGSVSETMPAV